MPKPWKGFGPTPDELYYKKWQELGPEANVADLYAYTDAELAKYEEQYADYIRRGISSAVHRKHPTLAYALKTLAGIGELPPVAALTRSAGTAVEKLFNAPGYAAEVSPTGQPVTTGIPWLDTGADVAGNLAATLAQFAIAAGLTKGAGGVLSKIPQLSRAAQLAPTAAKAAAEGAATGAAYTGLEALKGVPVTAKDLVTHAAFAGGAGLGGTLTRQAVAALKPGMKVLPEAVLTGTGAGLGAAAALYPFSDKKGLEYAKEAGINVATMALLHTGLAMIQPVRPEADFFNKTRAVVRSWADGVKAAKAGDKNLLQAKYREYWENINAAYHAGRRIKTDSPTKLPVEARIRLEEAWQKATTPEMKNVTPRSAAPPPTVTEATPAVSSPAPAPPAGAVAPPVPIETPIKPPAVQELPHTLAKALQQLTRTGSARINQTDLKIVPVGEGYGIEVVTGGNRQMHLAAPDTPYTDLAEANKAAVVKLRELALAPPAIQQQEPDIQPPTQEPIQPPALRMETTSVKTTSPRRFKDDREAQKAIDELEDEIEARYGEDQLNAARDHIWERGPGFADVPRQPTIVPNSLIDKLRSLYAERDALIKAKDDKSLNEEFERIPYEGPATKEEIQTVLKRYHERMKLDRALGYKDFMTADEFARNLYIDLSHKLASRGALPRHFAGDFESAIHETLNWESSVFGTSPRPLLEQVNRIVKSLFDQEPDILKPIHAQRKEASPVEALTAPPAIQQQEPDIQQPSPAIRHPIVRGATVEAKTEHGTKITARYAVVDAEDLIASHTLGLGVNPAYPQELQPRDRTRIASEAQISRIVNTLDPDFLGESPKASEGAPIIGPDRVVESGNARVIALQRSYAYNTPGAKAYRQWLVDNAEKFGLKPEDINVPNPVLVRIRQTDVDRARFAREANIQSTAAMSATEQAMADAQQLTSGLMSRFMPTDEGEILNTSNRDFIRSFMRDVVGPTEQARYITPDGSLSQEGLNRIRNAVFAKAYGNPAVLEKLAESTDSNIRNVTSAMLIAAPRYADIQERIRVGALHPLALTEEIGMATNKLASLREQGMSLETYLAQMQLFSDDMTPEAVRLLQAIQKYSRSRKKLAELFLATADAVEAVGMPGQEALFGGNVIPTKAEILEAAILKVEKKYEPIQQTGTLFEGEAAGSAVAPQTDATTRIVQEPKLEPTGTSTLASAGGYAPTPPPKEPLNPVELPELVELAREINAGKVPSVYKKLRAMHGQALGQFQVRGDEGRIALRADIFLGQEIASGTAKPMDAETRRKAMDEFRLQVAEKQGLNPEDLITKYEYDKNRHKLIFRVYRPDSTLAPKVLAHEIGHLIDWLPDHLLKRGNILGHLAALKKWLKTTIGQLPETPDKFLTAETRQRLQKEARQSAGEDKEAYAALYKQLLDKHIQEQKLVTKDEIMEELKNLTQQWKPFDVNANTEYTKYRYSPEELYADAISVLFNAPEIIEMTAPKFLDMLNAYSVRRPDVKQALEAIQSRYTNREAVVQHRLDAMYSMVERGSKKFSELSTPQRRETTLIDTLAKGLIDVHHPILKGVRQREKQKNFAEQARQARYLLEEMTYISSSINDYVYQNERQVRQVLEKAGATLDDLDVYLIYKRVMDRSDRATLANPLGTTPQSAAEGLKALRQRLGPEKYAAVELAAQNYRKLREEYIFPELEKSRFYSPETLQMLKERTNYAKFAVVDYMEQKYGKQVTAKIYQQIGTLKDIAGPYAPTVVQDMSMLRAAKINDAKRAVIADLRNANAVRPAERKYSRDAGTMIAVEPKDPELGLIIVMEDGKPTGYYVDKEIAQSFEFNPAQTTLAIPLWRAVNGALRDLFVGKNPIWQARNIFKDFSGTVIKLPQMRLRDVPKLVSLYKTAAKEVIAEVFRGERSKDISAALREYALPATRIYSTHDTTFDNELDRLVTEFLQPMLAEPSTPFAKKQWLRFMTFLHRMGQGSEMLGNLAGYKYLKKYHPKISIPERAHIVRNLVSTPPHKRHGAWHAFTNNVALFSNIGKEGIRTSIESFQTNPTRYAWKLTMLNIMPKLILKGAQLALAGTAFATLCDKISRYDKRMYTVIPLGLVNNGQDALYIRVPTDYEGQVIGAAVYDILEGRIFGTEGALRSLSNINPYQLNPLLDTAYKAFQIAVLGLNPIDEFYGSPVLSEQGFTAGGLPAAKEFVAYAWNSLGGNLLYRMPSGPELILDESTLQKLLRMPGFNIIGTFLRVSRNGEMSKVYDIKAQARKDAAQEQIARREEIIRAVNEGLDATQTYQRLAAKKLINPGKTSLNEFKRTYNTYKARQSGDPWDIGIETATSVEERRRIFAAMPEEKRKQYAPIYNLKTGEKW